MVWGDRRLGDFLGKPLDSHQTYGESWEVSDHPLHQSQVACGPLAGKTLRQLMEQDAAALLGENAPKYKRFPWLIKFLDAHDWLSVQVHPDEQAVAKLWPGEGSKTEAWFVLDAAPGSRIYAGLRPGVDERKLRGAVAAGKVTDCLHWFEPRPGDFVFLPAGTVHAVGGGVLIAEIQQTSDATFRLFDWNRRDAQGRSRPLHIEESLTSIHWDQGPVEPKHVADFNFRPVLGRGEPGRVSAGNGKSDCLSPRRSEALLVQCPYFELTYLRTREPISFGEQRRLQALVILQGRGRLGGSEEVIMGQVWVLPASLPRIECRPEPALTMLLCNLP
jgi:mannose-6-phosphate isomerase